MPSVRKRKHFHYGYGWLGAVVPAAARRFRVVDRELAEGLAAAGAELVDDEPDVEIAPRGELRGEAPFVVVSIDAAPIGGPLPVRAAGRLANSLRALVRARRIRHALRRRGYPSVDVVRWDFGHTIPLAGSRKRPRSVAAYLPQRALAVGRRGEPEPTVLAAALREASVQSADELRPRWASIRAGLVVVVGDAAVLRVAVGWARVQIASQIAALEKLRSCDPPPSIADRVPWPVAHGRLGLADWSLEQLLPGARPPRALSPSLLEDCVDFLVALRRLPESDQGGRSISDLAETVATVCRPDSQQRLHALADRLESELAGLPRGFAHGDFFAGNLLAEGDRLTAVLDWDGGGPGRLPVVDLLHLQLTRAHSGADDEWGRTLLARLLPAVRAGGDPVMRRYCRGVGLDADPRLLEALLHAYWLDYVAYQLRTHLGRRSEPRWIDGNVELVLAELGR